MISIHRAVLALTFDADLLRLLRMIGEACDPEVTGELAAFHAEDLERFTAAAYRQGLTTLRALAKLKRIADLVVIAKMNAMGLDQVEPWPYALLMLTHPN